MVQNGGLKECTLARNRNRLFLHLWKSVGRPSEGATYNCYKEARQNYRRICRQAVKKGYSHKTSLMNKLENKAGQMWNLVRKAKGSNNICSDAMDTERLKTYFTEKFSSGITTDIQREASHIVTTKYEQYIHLVIILFFHNIKSSGI